MQPLKSNQRSLAQIKNTLTKQENARKNKIKRKKLECIDKGEEYRASNSDDEGIDVQITEEDIQQYKRQKRWQEQFRDSDEEDYDIKEDDIKDEGPPSADEADEIYDNKVEKEDPENPDPKNDFIDHYQIHELIGKNDPKGRQKPRFKCGFQIFGNRGPDPFQMGGNSAQNVKVDELDKEKIPMPSPAKIKAIQERQGKTANGNIYMSRYDRQLVEQ